MSDVFISYSRKDRDFARKLFDELEASGRDSWIDWEGIASAAPDFLAEIYTGIENADTFLLIVTPDSLKSDICNLEIGHARQHHKRIVPVVHKEIIEQKKLKGEIVQVWFGADWEHVARANWEVIERINWLFVRDEDDFEAAFEELSTTLERDLDHVKFHTRLTTRARDWERNNQHEDYVLRGEDLTASAGWLVISAGKSPAPTALHREYIQASVRIRDSEHAKDAATLASMTDGLIMADEHGKIGLVNTAAERMLGLSADETLGRVLFDLVGIFGDAGMLDAISRWKRAYTQEDYEETLLEFDDARLVNVRISPVYAGYTFLGTLSVFRDITREVEVDRLKSEFISNVTHELRTPMTVIKGHTDLLMLGAAGEVSPDQRNLLTVLKTNAERLSALVDDLVAAARIDQDRQPLKFGAVTPDKLIDAVDVKLQHLQRSSGRSMTIEVVDRGDLLPPMRADVYRIMQVMQSLGENAFNYTPDGGHITLGAELNSTNDRVILWIADTGIGMSQEILSYAFERFFRGENSELLEHDTSGVGLGLSIAKSTVERHGGDIWIDSEEGRGSTVYVSLPIHSGG